MEKKVLEQAKMGKIEVVLVCLFLHPLQLYIV